MSFRKSLNKLLGRWGFWLEHSTSEVLQANGKLSVDLDFLVRNEVEKHGGNFSFIQIGANDGISRPDDIIKYVKMYNNTKGVMVEPQPDMFTVLHSNFKNFPGIKLVNKAIHNEKKSMTLYRFDINLLGHNSEKPIWATTNGIASFSRQHVIDHAKKLNLSSEIIQEIMVECISLDELFSEIDFIPILLKIDVEGYDYEILNELNLKQFRPKIIHFENLHMEKSKYQAIINKYLSYNYRFIADNMDTTAYLLM